jgi:septal ring factor EnvC (AmiA/AmiB activator)
MASFSRISLKIILNLAAAMILLCGATNIWCSETHQMGIVTVDGLGVQSEPGSKGLLQKTLKKGTEIKIVNRRQGWLQIIHEGEVGFVRAQAQYIKILSEKKVDANDNLSKQPNAQQSQVDIIKSRKKNIHREIEKGRQEVEAFKRKESDIIKRLDQVGQALNLSKRRTAALKDEIEKLDAGITKATKTSADLKKQIQANEDYVAKRLIAIYKINWLGKFHLLASAESMHEFVQRKAALEHILAYDEKIRRTLVNNQVKLKKVLADMEMQKARKSIRIKEYQKQIKIMSQERLARENLLADIRSQKALELAAIDALTQAANELDHKVKSLTTKLNVTTYDKYNSRLPFSAHKGLLIKPVNGKITNLFGAFKNSKYNITNFRSGIDIQADIGEPVRCVFKGKVLFSSWFKGYGNMIIIDHGTNYYTVYAHLEETFKSKGDLVETGEVIATAGDTGSMTGSKLYFEVRHHGKPVNPLLWLKKG